MSARMYTLDEVVGRIEAHWDKAPAVLEFKTRDPQRAFKAGWKRALAEVLNSFWAEARRKTEGEE